MAVGSLFLDNIPEIKEINTIYHKIGYFVAITIFDVLLKSRRFLIETENLIAGKIVINLYAKNHECQLKLFAK